MLSLNWNSPEWQETHRWLTEELDAKRAKLEQPTLTHDETQVVRGEIKVLKNILAQPDMAAQGEVPVIPDYDN